MPSVPYRSSFCLASLRISSATWRSRSSSLTELGTDAPIWARTRLETTDESVDIVVGEMVVNKGRDELRVRLRHALNCLLVFGTVARVRRGLHQTRRGCLSSCHIIVGFFDTLFGVRVYFCSQNMQLIFALEI